MFEEGISNKKNAAFLSIRKNISFRLYYKLDETKITYLQHEQLTKRDFARVLCCIR